MVPVIEYSTNLIDLRTNLPVMAVVQFNLSPQAVLSIEANWGPHRIAAVLKMIETGFAWEELPEHLHWNWSNKLNGYSPLIHQFVAVSVDSEMQGLMRADIGTARTRFSEDADKLVVYIDFLESAPWNTRQLTATPRYKLAGF